MRRKCRHWAALDRFKTQPSKPAPSHRPEWIGLDLCAQAIYRQAMQQAWDQGLMVASRGMISKAQTYDPLSQRLFLPVFNQGVIPASVAERHQQLKVFIGGILKVPILVARAWSDIEDNRLWIYIYEDGPEGAKQLRYTYPPELAQPGAAAGPEAQGAGHAKIRQAAVIAKAGL
jgi:hypothetical protein